MDVKLYHGNKVIKIILESQIDLLSYNHAWSEPKNFEALEFYCGTEPMLILSETLAIYILGSRISNYNTWVLYWHLLFKIFLVFGLIT